ncbi:unnamed protein product [Pleuronectes platessa]|uniref:Uncharacterized protein n=1 Tax=Pleuronectes platessa TaxID=8262 RepID=A0A9N7Y2E5_PLEPL|nr:unnamed protein product [Pleuronectes platessa]
MFCSYSSSLAIHERLKPSYEPADFTDGCRPEHERELRPHTFRVHEMTGKSIRANPRRHRVLNPSSRSRDPNTSSSSSTAGEEEARNNTCIQSKQIRCGRLVPCTAAMPNPGPQIHLQQIRDRQREGLVIKPAAAS